MLAKGFKFGMLLQFAIGPVCLMTFSAAAESGFIGGMCVTLAVTLTDSVFIALSAVGTSALLNGRATRLFLKLFGGAVLIAFGANGIAGAFGKSLLPAIRLFKETGSAGLFWRGAFITASNPLTIIFWGGVLSSQIAENSLDKREIALFGGGCALSTLVSLTVVSLLGCTLGVFLSDAAISALNIAVGFLLVFFGVKMLVGKEKARQA